MLAELAATLGFVLVGGVFVWGGIEHFRNFASVRAMLAGRGWPLPGPLLAAASILEIVAGVCLIGGIARPLAAAALAGFTVLATALLLDFWNFQGDERQGLRSAFILNFAVLGGLCLGLARSME